MVNFKDKIQKFKQKFKQENGNNGSGWWGAIWFFIWLGFIVWMGILQTKVNQPGSKYCNNPSTGKNCLTAFWFFNWFPFVNIGLALGAFFNLNSAG